MTLSKWRNNPGERGPAMCVHGGTSDPVSSFYSFLLERLGSGNLTHVTVLPQVPQVPHGPEQSGETA